jgi:hypothetical protein
MIATRRILLLLPLCLVLAAGCKPSRAPSSEVHGKVTYNGKPVSAGTIGFHPKEGGGLGATLHADGSYTVSGLPAGELIVTVETESANPAKRNQPVYGAAPGQKGKEDPSSQYNRMMKERGFGADAPKESGAYVPIPKQYADKDKSPLRANLTKGENTQNFDLKD